MILGPSWGSSMYRFNILLLCFFVSMTAWAQENSSSTSEARPRSHSSGFSLSSLSLGYVSWKEVLHLSNSGVTDQGSSNFNGNSLDFEYEHYWIPRWGWMSDVALMSGQAQLGGTMVRLPYQAGSVSWHGAEVSYRGAYRFATNVVVSAGPLILFRQVTIPADSDGSSVKSGASVNYGLVANANLRLTKSWEVKLSMGTLLADASTLWSLGFGYIF